MPTLETRVISGKGILRLDKTSNDFKKAKIITVFADVIRKPVNEYQNRNYNPVQSRYATLVFLRNTYVIRTEPLSYESQAWDFYPDPAAQTMFAVQCAYQGTLESFANLGTALGVTPISIVNNIEDWEHEDLFWDEIKVVCYADTAIQLVAESTEYELCPEQTDKEPNPPPLIPTPPDLLQPGEPLDANSTPVSPPYPDEEPGDTDPFEGDLTEEESPQGTACAAYTLSWQWTRASDGTVFNRSWTIRGEYVIASLDWNVTGPSAINWVMVTRGSSGLPSGLPACRPSPTLATLFSDTNGIPASISNINVVPV